MRVYCPKYKVKFRKKYLTQKQNIIIISFLSLLYQKWIFLIESCSHFVVTLPLLVL